jgi:hypothetical protein
MFHPMTALLIKKLHAAGVKVMVAVSTTAKAFILRTLLHPEISSVLFSHAENSIEQYQSGLLLLAFGIHVSFLWYHGIELRYRIAKLAAMVLIITTLSSIREVAVDVTALLNSIRKVNTWQEAVTSTIMHGTGQYHLKRCWSQLMAMWKKQLAL